MPPVATLVRTGIALGAALLAVVATSPATPAWAEEQATVDVLKVVDGEYVVETVTVPARSAEATADSLEAAPEVIVASPSVTYEVTGEADPLLEADDPQATSRVREVWDRTRGAGQVVAVLDTAATLPHPDLAGAAVAGTDVVGGTGDPWHGTGAAGVIAARADNGIGGAGMAPGARVMPVRVCNDGGCPSAAVARGILWAADHGADVINMSLAGAGYSDVSAAAVQYALDKGISVVASAGNDGLNGNPVMFPAANSGVIAVSATTPAGAPADWAVHGWQVDVSTVGESVLLPWPGDGYASASGTSFSGPAVAGAVALLRSAVPGITPEEVQAALQAGADSSAGWDRAWGAGRLDVPAALAAADRTVAPPSVTAAAGTLTVSWPAAGTGSYRVRMDGVVRAEVTGTSATVTGLTDGTQVAVDVEAVGGERSRPTLATPGPAPAGTPVLHSASLSGSATSAAVVLSISSSGPAAPRYSLVRDGLGVGIVPLTLSSTPRTYSIGIGAMPTSETRWQLRAVDPGLGRTYPLSNAVVAGSGRPAPPGAVTGLAAQVDEAEVLLTWDDLGAPYTYRVAADGTAVATPHTAGAVVPAPPAGEARSYEVVTVDAWGQSGPAVGTRVVGTAPEPPAAAAPGAPVIGQPTRGNGSATVRWSPPAVDGGAAVTGYTVSVHQGTTTLAPRAAAAGATSLTVTGLTNGTPYTFSVTATNAVGTGPASARSAVVTPATRPGAPAVGQPVRGDRSAVVRWTAPTATGGSPVTGYEVRAYKGTTPVRTVAAGPRATSLTVTGLANGTSYTFTVIATNAVGPGSASARSTAVTPATRPGAPVVGRPTAGNGSAAVRWAAPSATGGAPVTGYTVRAHRGTTLVRTVAAGPRATGLTVTGLTNGTPYTFTVTATNAVGPGPASARSTAVTPRR